MFCHFCGVLGHDLKHCAAHYVVDKNGGRVEYQYGDFLRVVGGRPRALTNKATSPMSNTEEGTGNDPKQNSGQSELVLLETTAARENGLGNPSSIDKGDPMN